MEALTCTYEDYRKAAGFSDLSQIAKTLPGFNEFFIVENGGMQLPSIRRKIFASHALDQFVESEFGRFSAPETRLFGENTLSITGAEGAFRVGHIERYCGPTLRMNAGILRAKTGGPVLALAHTHPFFRGLNASSLNRDGSKFGPGDWVSLVAFRCPVYLFTPRREIHVMEYDGQFVTVRSRTGGARKWRVHLR
jgi:hypothetical protein